MYLETLGACGKRLSLPDHAHRLDANYNTTGAILPQPLWWNLEILTPSTPSVPSIFLAPFSLSVRFEPGTLHRIMVSLTLKLQKLQQLQHFRSKVQREEKSPRLQNQSGFFWQFLNRCFLEMARASRVGRASRLGFKIWAHTKQGRNLGLKYTKSQKKF